MDFGKSFSKPFKKLKDKFPGGSRKQDGRSGSKDSRKGRAPEVEGSEASQRNSYLRSEVNVEGTVESAPSPEESNVGGKGITRVDDPPISTPSISCIGEPDST